MQPVMQLTEKDMNIIRMNTNEIKMIIKYSFVFPSLNLYQTSLSVI